ncbi:MAG: arginine--tRNA ligase, partial [Patescibacteria group bacterium]
YETEVQYYVDDTGVQVADTFVALKEFGGAPAQGQKFDHFCWDRYAQINAAYQKDSQLLEKRSHVLHALEDADSREAFEVKELASRILNDHLSSMADFGVSYDLLVWESDILRFEFWKRAFEVLQKSDSFTKETEGKNKGCWVLKTGEKSQDEEHSPDKILVKSDGTVTYTGKDIAYHLWKFDLLGKDFRYGIWKKAPQKEPLATTDAKGKKSSKYGRADRVYNVIDVRQAYPQAMVKLALEKLGYEKESKQLKHVSYGVVKLAGEGQMSGREGKGVKVDDLLRMVTEHVSTQAYSVQSKRSDAPVSDREIAVGVIKYFMLRYNPHSEIVFDLKEAGAITGNTGPYIQYAYARASGILVKADIHSFPKLPTGNLSLAEARLAKQLYRWVSVVEGVSETLNVNDITQYAFQLANSFNSFYEAHLVLKAEEPDRTRRLALVYAFRF